MSPATAAIRVIEAVGAGRPAAAATALERLPPSTAADVLTVLAPGAAAALFAALAPAAAADLLAALPREQALALLGAIDPAQAASVLAALAPEDRDRWAQALASREVSMLLRYAPGSAGAMMDPRVPVLRVGQRVGEARALLRARARDDRARARRLVPVVDEAQHFVGVVEMQDLALAAANEPITQYLSPPPVVATPDTPGEELAELVARHQVATVPVLDADGRLLGVVRQHMLLRATRDEATADLPRLFGASEDERALSPPAFSVRKRLPWLVVNLATAFLASAVVGLFEGTIARYAALAVLMPVVAGQSGNTGAQALAVAIRGLALRELRLSAWRRLLAKEAVVGLTNGVVIAAITAAGVWLWSGSAGLATVMGLSMVVSLVVATLAGAAVPLVLAALGQDPAQSSSIVLTTVTDVCGFLSFLGIATLLLHTL